MRPSSGTFSHTAKRDYLLKLTRPSHLSQVHVRLIPACHTSHTLAPPIPATPTPVPPSFAGLDSDTEGSNTDASDVPSLDSDLEQESAKSYTRVVYKEDIPKIRKQLKRAESSKLSKSRTEGKKTIAPNTSLSLEFVHG